MPTHEHGRTLDYVFCNTVAVSDFTTRTCHIDFELPSDHKAIKIGCDIHFNSKTSTSSVLPHPAILKLKPKSFTDPNMVIPALLLIKRWLAGKPCCITSPGVQLVYFATVVYIAT